MESLEKHCHLDLNPGVRRRLFSASAATMDRLLRPIREQAGSRRKRKQKRKMGSLITVRTFADWKEPEPGYLEIDLVTHCGGDVLPFRGSNAPRNQVLLPEPGFGDGPAKS